MQQATLKAYQNLKTYNPRWRYTTWLFTIALRELRSLARTRRPTQLADQFPEPTAPNPTDQEPGDLWRTAQRLLPSQHYTALWLRHGEDLPVRDIAKIIGRPRIWVSVTLHRACATLRTALATATNNAPAQSTRLTQSIRGVL